MKLFALILAVIFVIIFWPLVTIWAVNTLFGLGIAYTIWNWLAVLWLALVLTTAFGKPNINIKQ